MNDPHFPALSQKIRMLELSFFTPSLLRLTPFLIRIVMLLLFSVSLYLTEYTRARELDFPANLRMQGTIRAANLGKYFYFYGGEDSDTLENLDPELLNSWATTFEDYGLHILVVLDAVMGRTLTGQDYRVTRETVYQLLFALFVLTALVFLLPNLPLPLSLAGVLALWCSIRYGPVELSYDARGWGATYTAILVGMAILTAPLLRKRGWSIVYWLALSALTAFSMLLRQEVVISIYASMLALMLASGLLALVAYGVLADRTIWKQTALAYFRRITIAAVSLIVAVVLLPYAVRIMYAFSWHTAYGDTVFYQHGASMPLYLGLGFVSNPYNIVWLDPVAAYHAELYNPEVRTSWRDPAVDAPLSDGLREIAVDDPLLILKNVAAKARYAHYYLWHGETPQPNAYKIVEQTHTLQGLYRIALLVPVLMLGLAIYRKDLTLLVILAGALGLALGVNSGTLLVFPSYIGGAQGMIVFTVLLLPAALTVRNTDWQGIPKAAVKRVLFWALFSSLSMMVVVLVLASGWLFLRWRVLQDKLDEVKAADPLTEIQELEFRYGQYFNLLSPSDQENIIARLRTSGSADVALPDADTQGFFQPQVAILTPHQLHLIVWLGSEYPGAVDYINQGQVYSVIQVCSGCDAITRDYGYEHDALVYAFLNDSDWNGSYRLLSFAVDAADFQQAGFFQVVVQRLRFNGGHATEFNYMVDELSDGIRMNWN